LGVSRCDPIEPADDGLGTQTCLKAGCQFRCVGIRRMQLCPQPAKMPARDRPPPGAVRQRPAATAAT
jgi:hypothetical protein